MKLFYNIDNRLLTTENGASSNINLADFVRHFGLYPGSFVYEISERHETNTKILNDLKGLEMIKAALARLRQEMFRFAINDFGTGLPVLQRLYHSEPDHRKIDRFFIDGLARNRRKKLFVASTVNMARTLVTALSPKDWKPQRISTLAPRWVVTMSRVT
ncbi:MAG: EAL domain-containing protein [Desulfurivibrio sp.]|nr:EAL domain-containing protein [Desulfurivibrio sp.]